MLKGLQGSRAYQFKGVGLGFEGFERTFSVKVEGLG